MFFLNLSVIFISTLVYLFVNILIKNLFKIAINLLHVDVLLKIYLILLLISLSFCLFPKLNLEYVKMKK